jgi:hypothetical protein
MIRFKAEGRSFLNEAMEAVANKRQVRIRAPWVDREAKIAADANVVDAADAADAIRRAADFRPALGGD